METSTEKNKKPLCDEKKDLLSTQHCPYCQHSVELVWVHGHYQCPNCKHVVISCCGDS